MCYSNYKDFGRDTRKDAARETKERRGAPRGGKGIQVLGLPPPQQGVHSRGTGESCRPVPREGLTTRSDSPAAEATQLAVPVRRPFQGRAGRRRPSAAERPKRTPPSASSDAPARLLCPSGPEDGRPASAPSTGPAEGVAFGLAADASGEAARAAAGVGAAPVAGGEAVPWTADDAGPGVGGAGTCAGWAACRGDEARDGAGDTVGAAPDGDGDGDGLFGAVGCGVGEADDGRGAGQIFTGRSPAGAHGAAVAGNARTSGAAASTRAAADV